MSAQPLQPLPQFNTLDCVSWSENGVEHEGHYIGPDPQFPNFARVEPADASLLADGENSVLVHPSQLEPVAHALPPAQAPEDKPELGDKLWYHGREVAVLGIDDATNEYQVRPAGTMDTSFMVSGTELSREAAATPTELPKLLEKPEPKQSTAAGPPTTAHVPDFESIARAAIGRGEPHVVPIVVGGKNPAIKWKNDPDYNVDMYSTPEMNQISDKWIQGLLKRGFKNFNAAVIAREDNVCFLDDDKHAEFVAAYEEWSGEKYPSTYATSARENRWQIHFRQTDKTRELGNIIQTQVDGLDFSVRQSNEYVVAEGSIYKDGVNVYRCVDPAAIVPMPDKLVEFITKKVAESGRTKSSPAKATLNADGTRKLIPQGLIHDALFAQAKLLRDAGLSPAGIESALLGWYRENCEPPAEGREAAAAEKVKQVAASVGSAGQLTIGGLPVGAVQPPPEATQEEKAAQELGITVEEVNKAREESTGETKQQVGKTRWFSYFYYDDDNKKVKETARFEYPAIKGSYRDYVASPQLGQEDGWFPLGDPSVVAGSSGTGKTTLIMDLLEKQLAKDPVCGHNTYGRPYVVVMVDRGEDSNKRTLERLGIDPSKVTVKYIEPCFGAEAWIAVKDKIEEDGPAAIPQIVFIEGADELIQDGNKACFVSEFLTRAQKLAKHYHLALILSVGAPKQKLGEGYTAKRDNIIGSATWGRKLETVVIMSYVKNDDMGKKRVCSVLPRNGPPEEFRYVMTQAGRLMPDTSEETPEALRAPEIDWFKDQAAEGKNDPAKQWWTTLDLQRGLNVGHSSAYRFVKDALAKEYIVKKRGRKDAKGCADQYQWNESETNPLWTPDPPEEQQDLEM